jgi:Rad3-related DNA helicase
MEELDRYWENVHENMRENEEFWERLSDINERISELRSKHPGIDLSNITSMIQNAQEVFNAGDLQRALGILEEVEDLLDRLKEGLSEGIGPPEGMPGRLEE